MKLTTMRMTLMLAGQFALCLAALTSLAVMSRLCPWADRPPWSFVIPFSLGCIWLCYTVWLLWRVRRHPIIIFLSVLSVVELPFALWSVALARMLLFGLDMRGGF